jgi:hypothetical protein
VPIVGIGKEIESLMASWYNQPRVLSGTCPLTWWTPEAQPQGSYITFVSFHLHEAIGKFLLIFSMVTLLTSDLTQLRYFGATTPTSSIIIPS